MADDDDTRWYGVLPSGMTASNHDEYVEKWSKATERICKHLDMKMLQFDPGVSLVGKERGPVRSFWLPTWFLERLDDAFRKLEWQIPDPKEKK